MPDFCAAFGCSKERNDKTKQQGITFHRFPKDKVRRQAWTAAVRRTDFEPNDCSVVCSCHFKPEDFDRTGQTTRLKEGVIPSVFTFPDHLCKEPSESRSSRTSQKAKKRVTAECPDVQLSEDLEESTSDHHYALDPVKVKQKLTEAQEKVEELQRDMRTARDRERRQCKKTVKSLLELLKDKNMLTEELQQKLDIYSDLPVELFKQHHALTPAQREFALDSAAPPDVTGELCAEMARLQKQVEETAVSKFGLERFAASDDDIRKEQPCVTHTAQNNKDPPMDVIHQDHDYCSATEPSAPPDLSGELRAEMARLQKQVEETAVSNKFGLERFAACDDDIRFYTRKGQPCVTHRAQNNKDPPMDVIHQDHDYCSATEPSAPPDLTGELRAEIARLQKQVEETAVSNKFGLGRFAASDDDIRFYTRFASHAHLMAFWRQIEPATHKMVHVTRARTAANTNEVPHTGNMTSLQLIDEFFLFMTYLALGLMQTELAHRFKIHQSAVCCIITTWANFLYTVLGAVGIWMSEEEVKAHLPDVFQNYSDIQLVLDCTELHCQTPNSLLLQSEVFSTCKSHCTFKGLIGMAPHGAITFVSALYAGSISDKEILKKSGIVSRLKPTMAIIVDKGFLVEDCVPCKVYTLALLSKRAQLSVSETQSVIRLRDHVERLIRRVKEHKIFKTVIPLSLTGSINQLYTVACLLVNYQNGPLGKA